MSRKERIAGSFAAARAYDEAALAQAHAAARLLELALAAPLPADPAILELGCGTGLLTGKLLERVAGGRFLITDLAAAMVERAAARCPDPRAAFRVMDAEAPDVPAASQDLIVSSLAAQWFLDLPAALARLSTCLKPGGRLVLSTLGSRSFAEWRRAHQRLGLACGTPAYPDQSGLRDGFPAGGEVSVIAEAFVLTYPTAHDFVRSIKAIGAGTPAPGHRPLSPAAFRQVLSLLGERCAITYDLLYAVFIKDRP